MVPFPFPGPFPGFSNGMLFFFCSFLPGGVVFFQLSILGNESTKRVFFLDDWKQPDNPEKKGSYFRRMKSILDVDV